MEVKKELRLSSNHTIPSVGLGTWGMQGLEEDAVRFALDAGYRHFDTAKIYGTEDGIGKALRESGIGRQEIFITTKLWNTDQGFDTALIAIEHSLERLRTDYVDLYLIHWPLTQETEGENHRAETWRAMEQILASGKARSIGVSNYEVEHLKEMEGYAKVTPAVNQIERHPFYQQEDTTDYCEEKGIVVTNYSPLVRGRRTSEPEVERIANTYGKTGAQIYLRWGLQHGNVVIPKSAQKNHIKENIHLFDFEISAEDMEALDGLDEGFSAV